MFFFSLTRKNAFYNKMCTLYFSNKVYDVYIMLYSVISSYGRIKCNIQYDHLILDTSVQVLRGILIQYSAVGSILLGYYTIVPFYDDDVDDHIIWAMVISSKHSETRIGM